MKLEAFLSVAIPAVAGLLAVSAVLFIKVKRRSQAATRRDVATVVQVRPIRNTQVTLFKRCIAGAAVVELVALAGYAAWLQTSA
jgi:hypothetical protein